MTKTNYLTIFTLALITFSFNTKLYSQNSDFNYGLKGGIDFFNYPIEETNSRLEIDYDFGFFIGIYGKINFNDKLNLRPELILRRHRAVEKISDVVAQTPSGLLVIFTNPTEVEVSDYIIQLPIRIQHELISNLELGIGPQLMCIVDREFQTTKNTIDFFSEISENSDIISNIEYDQFDIGLSLGVNYQFNSSLGIFINYTAGLIERDDKINTSILDLGISWRIK
jgi:hypothetical protein